MANMNDSINHAMVAKNTLQALTTLDWEFQIDYVGQAMYQPNFQTVFIRTTAVSGLRTVPSVSLLDVQLRGYSLLQPGIVTTKPEPVSLTVQDLEDQTVVTWMWDWANKMSNMANLASYRREDLFANITFWQLNSSRQKVFEFKYFNCLPDTSGITGYDFSNEKNIQQPLTIAFQAEYMEPKPLNLS